MNRRRRRRRISTGWQSDINIYQRKNVNVYMYKGIKGRVINVITIVIFYNLANYLKC